MRAANYVTISIGLLIVLLGAILLPSIEVNNDIKSTFTEESDKREHFDSLNGLFKQQIDPLIISFTRNEGFRYFSEWKQLESVSSSLKQLFPHDSIVSVFDIITLKKVGSGLYEKPLINLSGEDLYPGWEERLNSYSYLSDNFISKDLQQVNCYIYTDDWGKGKEAVLHDVLSDSIYNEVYDSYFLLSDPIVNAYVKEKVVSDLYSLALFGFVIILVLFYFFFRNVKIIVLIGVIAAINVNATIILMYLVDLEFNILTSIVPTIISILSVTDLNHIAYATQQGEDVSKELKRLPIVTGLLQLRKTLIATSVTTAIGFAIFLFNDVSSVRVFAVISILGIFISLVNVFIFAPAFYRFLSPKQTHKLSFRRVSKVIGALVVGYYSVISIVFMLALILITVGTYFHIQVDYNPRNNLNKGSELSERIKQFDDSFKNTKAVELIVSFPSETKLEEVILVLDELESDIISQVEDSKVISINNVVKEYNRIFNKGKEEYYRLPNELDSLLTDFIAKDTALAPMFYEPTGLNYKIMIQMPYYNAAFTQERLQLVLAEFKAMHNSNLIFGGVDHYEDESALGLVYSVLSGIFISIVIISLLTAIFFRNRGYFLPTLLVNFFPILSSLLLVSILYGQINPSIVIILSIAFGIALDDTMYFVSKLSQISSKTKVKDLEKALLKNIDNNTFPMISTSVTLSGSFCALLFSSFEINTINAFILIATLLIAMVSDLIILPALILFFHKKRSASN